jgi:hypothetical protein
MAAWGSIMLHIDTETEVAHQIIHGLAEDVELLGYAD